MLVNLCLGHKPKTPILEHTHAQIIIIIIIKTFGLKKKKVKAYN